MRHADRDPPNTDPGVEPGSVAARGLGHRRTEGAPRSDRCHKQPGALVQSSYAFPVDNCTAGPRQPYPVALEATASSPQRLEEQIGRASKRVTSLSAGAGPRCRGGGWTVDAVRLYWLASFKSRSIV